MNANVPDAVVCVAEITRRVAPYVGLVHERAFGPTADLRRAAGESATDTRIVLGIHAWF